ncbi:hypothetical protein ACHAXH_000261, partial [Discostella pseudostelligera]
MSKRNSQSSTPPGDEADVATFNPISKWQEYEEVPGLTLFDIHREPRREDLDPNAMVTIKLKTLDPDFQCPVCLGYLKTTRIVKECLHRFCNECIEKCLRSGMKQCPQCRIYIPSRRSLRPDTNFDELIKKIYGDVSSLEKYEEEENAQLNKQSIMNNEYYDAESIKRRILHQNEQRKKKPGVTVAKSITQPITANSAHIGSKNNEPPRMEIVLRRHPQEMAVERLSKEFIRTSQEATIEQLKMFLGMKLSYSPYCDFQILAIAGEDAVILPDDISLIRIRREICDDAMNELILYYRI